MSGRGWRALLLFGLCAVLAPAQTRRGDDWRISPRVLREEVRSVVTVQLAALRVRDYETAYLQTSRELMRRFSPEQFVAMLRRGYPALFQHTQADLGFVRDREEVESCLTVEVTGPGGRRAGYRFYLVHQKDGWKIDGIVPDRAPGRGDI